MLKPKTWKTCRDEKLNKYYDIICRHLLETGQLNSAPSFYTFKSVRNWGRMRGDSSSKETIIGLNEIFIGKQEEAVNTICHELAHCVYPKDHHSYRWQRCAESLYRWATKELDIKYYEPISRLNATHGDLHLQGKNKVVNYVLTCPKCDCVVSRYVKRCDAVRRPYRWIHSSCHTTLESHSINVWENRHSNVWENRHSKEQTLNQL